MDLQKRLQSINNVVDVQQIIEHLKTADVSAEDKSAALLGMLTTLARFASSGHNQTRPIGQTLEIYIDDLAKGA